MWGGGKHSLTCLGEWSKAQRGPSSLSTRKCKAKAELLEQRHQAEEPDQRQTQPQRQGLLSVPRLSNFHKKESSFLVQQQGGLFSSLSLYSPSYPLITIFRCLSMSPSPSSQGFNGALFLLPWRNCGSLAAWEALLGTKEEGWFLLWGFEKKKWVYCGNFLWELRSWERRWPCLWNTFPWNSTVITARLLHDALPILRRLDTVAWKPTRVGWWNTSPFPG